MLYLAVADRRLLAAAIKWGAGDEEYLRAFRKECLRYCPPIEILPRKVAAHRREAAVELLPDLADAGANDEFPVVCPCVHRVHHDPSVHSNPGASIRSGFWAAPTGRQNICHSDWAAGSASAPALDNC